jgi:hypothetical protein
MILSSAAAGCFVFAAFGVATLLDADSGNEGVLVPPFPYSFEPREDLDYDNLPDDWVRRKGLKFPNYVKVGIDGSAGCDGEQSLRIDSNGGAAVLYSPLTRIDALHTYRFRGKIRTKNLTQDGAVISVSLLNHRRQRVQRFLTPAVTGDRDEWQTVQLPSITPLPDVRFVVIGCHLLPGDEPGISGAAWFDDLVLTRSPGLSIAGNFRSHFLNEDSPVQVESNVSGLDAGHTYAMHFEFFDAEGACLEQRREELAADAAVDETADSAQLAEPRLIVWELPKQKPGYYRMAATLLRDGKPHLREQTTLAVMRLVERRRTRGEFGWSLGAPLREIEPLELVDIAAQAGISWIKFPVWDGVDPGNRRRTGELAEFFDQLENRQIYTVGLLSDPPQDLRLKFARNWLGVSEIFGTQSSVWGPTVEPVVARFSSAIRQWQLGDENDTSFEGLSDLAGTLERTHQVINRIGLNAQIGVPWETAGQLPRIPAQTLGFVSLREKERLPLDALVKTWQSHKSSGAERWVVLQPAFLAGDATERANQLVRQMIAAKTIGVEKVFVNHVLGGRDGLLNADGSPSDLFLPWRTTALALQDSEYLGELVLPQGSRNAVFTRNLEDHKSEVVIFIWNDKPAEEPEQFYLGENVVETDLWGRSKPARVNGTKEQIIEVTTTPKILRGCSEPVARWRLAAKFAVGKIKSEYGTHEDAVLGKNTFDLGVSGKVLLETPSREPTNRKLDDLGLPAEFSSGWQAEPREWTLTAAAHEEFRLPVFLTLPNDANIGDTFMKLTFTITADRSYRFQVLCPYQVGSGDVSLHVIDRPLPDGRLEIEQIVRNATGPIEVLDFRCSLMVPGSRRQKVQITRLGLGEDRKFYYLPNAAQFRGKDLRLKLEQEGGGRILNHKWTVGADWQDELNEYRSQPSDDTLPAPPRRLDQE